MLFIIHIMKIWKCEYVYSMQLRRIMNNVLFASCFIIVIVVVADPACTYAEAVITLALPDGPRHGNTL